MKKIPVAGTKSDSLLSDGFPSLCQEEEERKRSKAGGGQRGKGVLPGIPGAPGPTPQTSERPLGISDGEPRRPSWNHGGASCGQFPGGMV